MVVDWYDLLSKLITGFMAVVPELVMVSAVLGYNLSRVKSKLAEFGTIAESTKQTLTDSFTGENATLELVVSRLEAYVTEKITQSLFDMRSQLSLYQAQLALMTSQFNAVSRENKVFLDVISSLVSKDPSKVRSGVATLVSVQIEDAKNELEKSPDELDPELPQLTALMKEAIALVGQDNFDVLLGKAGYVKKQ